MFFTLVIFKIAPDVHGGAHIFFPHPLRYIKYVQIQIVVLLLLYCILYFIFYLISLIADGLHHYHPVCGHKGSSHLSPVHALQFLSRCKFSTLTTRQPMIEFYLLTFPRFPLRKKEHKSYSGKNRTHDFRTSRCAGYLLDHSGGHVLCLYKNFL